MSTVTLHYRRSGGFANIRMSAETTADQLPTEVQPIAASLLAEPPVPRRRGAPGMADGFHYQLQVDDGRHRRSFAWSDPEIPDGVRPLLKALHGIATYE